MHFTRLCFAWWWCCWI